jgi:hypothetical protein
VARCLSFRQRRATGNAQRRQVSRCHAQGVMLQVPLTGQPGSNLLQVSCVLQGCPSAGRHGGSPSSGPAASTNKTVGPSTGPIKRGGPSSAHRLSVLYCSDKDMQKGPLPGLDGGPFTRTLAMWN